MKKIVMLVCVFAFGVGMFVGCGPGEMTVETPDKGTKPKLTFKTPGGDGPAATTLN